jgi:uncharacterized membrane protein YoaK (UPF0700 family)
MAVSPNTSRTGIKALVALILAFSAGCVDIVGFISFGHVFTAHMTGTTVHLGQRLMEFHWLKAAEAAGFVAAFVGGSIAGRAIIEIGSRRRMHSIAVATLLLESALIALVIPLRASRIISLVFLAAAMGVQTATLTRVGSLTIHTTFVTGMLNKLAQLLSHAVFLFYDRIRGSQNAASTQRKTLLEARFIFSVWVLYLAGAAMGTFMNVHWGVAGLVLPASVVSVLAIVDLWSPLAIEEERDQSER